MNLQELYNILENTPADYVPYLDNGNYVSSLISWRGDYHQLSLDNGVEARYQTTVQNLTLDAEEALDGKVFVGYKGGNFIMGPYTAVYANPYGEYCSQGLKGYYVDGKRLVFETIDLSDYV